MDEFTPYFKAIVDALPVQQQRIFDAVALAWDPVEVATLAMATRLPSNQVSAQLRMLVKAGLLQEAAGAPKRKTYLLADRFSNIHYLMRHGRAARNRLDWFVALVRIVFPDQASAPILARTAREAAECGPEGWHDARCVLHSALARAESGEARRTLMHATLREGWESAAWESLDEWFDAERAKADLPEMGILGYCRTMPAGLRKELGYKPENARWWYGLTDYLEEKKAWLIAEAAYQKAIDLDPRFASSWNGLGNLLSDHLGRPVEAEAAYRQAIKLEPKSASPWNNLGNLLIEHLGRHAEAEVAYRKAIELESTNAVPWLRLGSLLRYHLDRPAEAEAAYRKAIELDPKWSTPWNCLSGLLLREFDRTAEAETTIQKAIELDPESSWAWGNLGYLLSHHRDRPVEAEAAYRKAIELNSKDGFLWAALATILNKRSGLTEEVRRCAVTALSLNPSYDASRRVFHSLCGGDAVAWLKVLPGLITWCASHPKADKVFDFTVSGLLRLARLTQAAEALALLDSLPDATPFQTVRDAFVTHGQHEHLHTLAPERKSVVLALLDRIAAPPDGPNALSFKAKPKTKKKK